MHLQFLCLSHTPSVGSEPLTLLWLAFQLSLSFPPGPCSNNALYILVPVALCRHCWYKVDKSRNSYFVLIAAAIVSPLPAKNEGCMLLPYLNVCYNGVLDSNTLGIRRRYDGRSLGNVRFTYLLGFVHVFFPSILKVIYIHIWKTFQLNE